MRRMLLALITGMALAWFRIPFRGDPLLLLVATMLFVTCALANGLLVSTVSRTQQEAFLSSFLVFMPLVLLSGFMFPVASMPRIFQWLTLANPLRHFMEIVRGVFLMGVGLERLWPQHLALLALGALFLGLAGGRFRKRVA